MGRKKVDASDAEILQKTIEVASKEERGTCSTREIADRCKISEYVIFDRFKSKDNLLKEATKFITARFFAWDKEFRMRYGADREGFFNAYLDRLLSAPEDTRFAGNYLLVFPRQGDLEQVATFAEDVRDKIAAAGAQNDPNAFFLFVYEAQEVVQDALLILSHQLEDTAENRHLMFTLIHNGLEGFGKIAD